ncbi:Fibronectin type 3 and ankyrin repeat domains 1 protein [Anabarilius grahami]|uniref:Fibronectin type 3 and ankyrin repeat domains 1 protein n=1 Tax=Anabarilius grahami TaxID=495550 RepID=A0A3N0XNR8_ANAGA|nr:Fibronectin type 3 and ankyrin repeat domains 1 protein [Anabarilius grahami]
MEIDQMLHSSVLVHVSKTPLNTLGVQQQSGVLTVGQMSHHSIELTWTREHGWADPPDQWTCFTLEQKNAGKNSYREIYKGYSTCFTVENLEPKTTYTFRLKDTWPSGQQRYYPSISASTEKEPLNGRNLHNAVLRNDEVELCQVLQSRTVIVDVPDKLDFTPLMIAVSRGFTSLMLACFHGHLDVVKFLRSCGASWTSRDRSGCCALHWATVGGHLPILQYLIQDGCEADVQDSDLWTPLMIVSLMSGDTAVASLLISAGADVNVKDKDGKTPLMVAVLNNHKHLVKMLLEKGADPNIQNKLGVSALDMAKAFNREKIISLVLDEESEMSD